MVTGLARLISDDRTVAEIKDDLYNTLGYDVFLAKRSKMIYLPDRMYQVLISQVFWYVMIAVQPA